MAAAMMLSEKVLLHQVHPPKLATDIGAAAVSLYFIFFWEHQLARAHHALRAAHHRLGAAAALCAS